MSEKTKKIVSLILMGLPSLMLIMSGAMKLIGNEEIVTNLTKAGFGSLISVLGLGEFIFVALLWYGKTTRLGLLFITGYLGGAGAIEISTGQPPAAFILLSVLWLGVYIKDKETFFTA